MNNAKVAIELHVDDKGTLRIKQFASNSEQSFEKVERAGTGAAKKIKAGWKGIWKKIAIGATTAVAAVSALVITSAREAKELENLARVANMTAKEFRGAAYATEKFGISGEKLADMSKDVQDKLGDFIANGAGEFKDFFENIAPQVGLTAKELQNLSGPDVLIAVKKAMDEVGVSAEEQVFYMESIANDASLLIPLLKDEGKMFKETAERASELGLALDKVDHENLLEAGEATKEATSALGGLKNMVAAEFAPLFADAMRWATGMIINLKDEARSLAGTFVNVGESIKGWNAVLDGRLGFFEFATMDAKEFDEWLEKNSESVADLAEETVEANTSKTKSQGEYNKELGKTTKAIEKQKKAIKQQKKEEDEKAKTQEEMYKELGVGAEAYFSAEASELVKKAAKWKEAGADTLAVEEWLYDQLGLLSEQAWEKQESAAGLAMDNLQAQTGTLVEEVTSVTEAGMERLRAMGIEIEGLDGSAFTVYASLDGSGVESTVDALIAKFQALQAAAIVPISPAGGNSSPAVSSNEGFTPDLDWQAEMVANAPGGNTTNININQQLSRSDVTSIIAEGNRLEDRS